MGWMVNAAPWSLYPWETDPVPVVWGTECAIGSVWTGQENLAATGKLPMIDFHLHYFFPKYVRSAKYGCFLFFLDVVLSACFSYISCMTLKWFQLPLILLKCAVFLL